MTDMELAEEVDKFWKELVKSSTGETHDYCHAATISKNAFAATVSGLIKDRHSLNGMATLLAQSRELIAALRRGHEVKRAMIDDVPLCAGHADWWFTSRNHLKGDTSCVVCAFNPERPPSGEMVMGLLGFVESGLLTNSRDIHDWRSDMESIRDVLTDWLSAAEAEGRKS